MEACSESPRSDAELLAAYIEAKDEGAFAQLVARHGAMVLGACRRLVKHPSDADDAFQATFLILVESAKSIRHRGSLAAWLHRVAVRAARQTRGLWRKDMQAPEGSLAEIPHPGPPSDHGVRDAIDTSLDELPEVERAAILLCDVEGWKHREAAAILGVPVSTVSNRLARGRATLRRKLIRRGVVAGLAVVSLTPREVVSEELLSAVLATAKHTSVAGFAETSGVPSRLAQLCRRALSSLSASETAFAGAVLLGCLLAGASLLRLRVPDHDPAAPRPIMVAGQPSSCFGGLPVQTPPPSLQRAVPSFLTIGGARISLAQGNGLFLARSPGTARRLQTHSVPKLLGP